MIIPKEISDAIPFLAKRAILANLGQHLYGEVRKKGADGRWYILDVYALAGVGTEDGLFSDGDEFYFDPHKEFAISKTPPSVIVPPAGFPPYSFPQALTDNGACGEEGHPIASFPFYRINSAVVLQGVSAFANVSLKGKGAQIVNLFPDGHGEVFAVVDDGNVQFNFGATSAFSTPCAGPFTIFIALGAVKDPVTHVVTWKNILSDLVHSVGDWNAEHSEWRIQFAQVQ